MAELFFEMAMEVLRSKTQNKQKNKTESVVTKNGTNKQRKQTTKTKLSHALQQGNSESGMYRGLLRCEIERGKACDLVDYIKAYGAK